MASVYKCDLCGKHYDTSSEEYGLKCTDVLSLYKALPGRRLVDDEECFDVCPECVLKIRNLIFEIKTGEN